MPVADCRAASIDEGQWRVLTDAEGRSVMTNNNATWIHLASAVLLSCAAGCSAKADVSSENGRPAQYAVALTASTPSILPKCSSALDGTVAHVDSPPSLWACTNGKWKEITCGSHDFDQIAYADSKLWACVREAWTPVALPPGPTGPQGETGAPGPAGKDGVPGKEGASALAKSTEEPVVSAHCPDGGVRVDLGTDDDADGVLDAAEVTSTFYVCNGEDGRDNTACNDVTYAELRPNLAGCYLPSANLSGAILPNVNLSRALLTKANLSAADLSGADLSGADLSSAQLGGAAPANLSGANLSSANLSGASCSNVNLSHADLTGANLSGAYLKFANLSSAVLVNAMLDKSFLYYTNFSGANLKGATLTAATIEGVVWKDTTCPDGSNSDENGGACMP
jgi:Pentapeptide repeats (8 copies)